MTKRLLRRLRVDFVEFWEMVRMGLEMEAEEERKEEGSLVDFEEKRGFEVEGGEDTMAIDAITLEKKRR